MRKEHFAVRLGMLQNYSALSYRKGPFRQQWSEEEGELVPVKFSLQ